MKRFIIVSSILSLISYSTFAATKEAPKPRFTPEKPPVTTASTPTKTPTKLDPVKVTAPLPAKKTEKAITSSKPIEKPVEKTFFSKLKNWEIGFGVPLIPMGYNGFVGYVNKNSESFWGKRIGGRLDFQIPDAMDVGYTVGDCIGEKCDVTAEANLLFLSKSFDTDIDQPTFDSNDDGIDEPMDITEMNGKFAMDSWNIGGLLDFYPFGNTWFFGGIRLTGGYYFGDMTVSLQNNVENDLPTASGWEYSVDSSGTADQIIARVKSGSRIGANFKWAYSGPYVGLGFDLGVLLGFKIYMDAGVVFATPPKVKRSDIRMPAVTACYKIYGETTCGSETTFDLNEKPVVNDWIVGVTAGMLDAKINGATSTIPAAVKDDIAVALIGPGSTGDDLVGYDFTGAATDIIGYIDGTLTGAGTPDWMQDIFAATDTDSVAIEDALNNVQTNWTSGEDISTELQSDIDDAWADYEQGIADLNDSLEEMQWMPIIKLGVMYRF